LLLVPSDHERAWNSRPIARNWSTGPFAASKVDEVVMKGEFMVWAAR
jgi:hypothetical protein